MSSAPPGTFAIEVLRLVWFGNVAKLTFYPPSQGTSVWPLHQGVPLDGAYGVGSPFSLVGVSSVGVGGRTRVRGTRPRFYFDYLGHNAHSLGPYALGFWCSWAPTARVPLRGRGSLALTEGPK